MSSLTTPRNTRILIIDDNRAIHDDFRKVLSRPQASSQGFDEAEASLFGEAAAAQPDSTLFFDLDSAYQGEEGLALVKDAVKRKFPYAVAFVDVRMPPGLDGVETTSRIWELDPDLQVVICTAYSDCSWSDMLEKLGRSDRLVVLKKPFDSIEVQQLANSLTQKWQLLQESKNRVARLEGTVLFRTAQMAQEQEKFKAIFDHSPEGIFQAGSDGRILTANAALAEIYGYSSPAEIVEQLTDISNQLYADPGRPAELQRRLQQENVVREFQSEIKCKDGSRKWISETACKVVKPDGSLLHYQGFVVDITAQKNAQKERDLIETQLRQAQKLESVGQLAAGIAHEINTPIQYIGDNIHFIEDSFASLGGLLQECRKFATAMQANAVTAENLSTVESSINQADIEYLSTEVPLAIQQSLQGVDRVSRIVSAMKEFSHPGSGEKVDLNLNHAIETTITVARGEWKYVADLETDFDPSLPPIRCLPGEFNQVILNLIVNAAHTIGDVCKQTGQSKGVIRIATRYDKPWAEIRISDTGAGIPEKIRHRIFDPFFTTKEVGKGTGQGLAIAHSVVVDKHGGTIAFETEIGRGTTFIIRLPANDNASIEK